MAESSCDQVRRACKLLDMFGGRTITTLFVTAVSALSLAGSASADYQDYFDLLHEDGIADYTTVSQAGAIGDFFCKQMRGGRDLDSVYSDLLDYGMRMSLFPAKTGVLGQYMSAAAYGLCPDQRVRTMNENRNGLHYLSPARRSPAV